MISAMPNTGLAIELQPAERTQLEQGESAHGTPQQVALRCRLILRAVAGQQNVAIAAGRGVSRPTGELLDEAVVLCVDETSQIQGLDRTQAGLPLKKGRCGTMTHDYKRNGTTTLFAALNVLDGKVIGECHGRHRHQEWRKFLRRLDAEFPPELKLHVVMDNYGTHKEPHVAAWLKKHPRFVCHFVPTSSSWLNLVERWFRELTEKAIRRGSFLSVPELQQSIDAFMQAWNKTPTPFIWSATVEDIIKKIDRARVKMEQIKPGSTQPRGKKKTAVL